MKSVRLATGVCLLSFVAGCGGGGSVKADDLVLENVLSGKLGQPIDALSVPVAVDIPDIPLFDKIEPPTSLSSGGKVDILTTISSESLIDALFLKVVGSPTALKFDVGSGGAGTRKIATDSTIELAIGDTSGRQQLCFELSATDQLSLVSFPEAFCIPVVAVENPNQRPVVTIEGTFEGAPGETISLVATATDPDGDAVDFLWLQLSGTLAQLDSADTANLAVALPNVSAAEQLQFQVIATDAQGLFRTATAAVQIVVPNGAPTIDLETFFRAESGEQITLAADVTDIDGNLDSVVWSQVRGSNAQIISPNQAETSVQLPEVDIDTTLVFKLVATDSSAAVTEAQVVVVVEPAPPSSTPTEAPVTPTPVSTVTPTPTSTLAPTPSATTAPTPSAPPPTPTTTPSSTTTPTPTAIPTPTTMPATPTPAPTAPDAFTVEYLAGKTLYVVWFGTGEDANGNEIFDVPVVCMDSFGMDNTATIQGLRNCGSTTQNFTVAYDVTPSGLLYFANEINDGNTVVCGSTDDYIKTHYSESGVFDNVDLFFFDRQKAIDFADQLTESIAPCPTATQ